MCNHRITIHNAFQKGIATSGDAEMFLSASRRAPVSSIPASPHGGLPSSAQ